MRAETAARYLDVSKTTFLTTIAPELREITVGKRVKAFRRTDLDNWLDLKAGIKPKSDFKNPWH